MRLGGGGEGGPDPRAGDRIVGGANLGGRGAGIEFFEPHIEVVVIGRERHDELRACGEQHDPHAVPALLSQRCDQVFRACHGGLPARHRLRTRYIVRPHASAKIEHQHQVAADRHALIVADAPARPGQPDGEA